jgi:hypothetical protein
MPSNLKSLIARYLINLPGWHTIRKIVVIESDDWGSIRMPSKEVFLKLQKMGYKPENDPYLRYDSLASEEDLSALFDVLHSVKDKNGDPVSITANCVVANPDFKKIRESGFNEYFFETFTDTLKRYPAHQNSFALWKQGISQGLFYPQFHGREHLNVDRWLNALKRNEKPIRDAFEHEMISISSEKSEMKFAFMESLDFFSEEEEKSKLDILNSGMDLFEKTFGYKSDSFIANCYIWNENQEVILQKRGIKYIQSNPFQLQPYIKKNKHRYQKKIHYTGQANRNGQLYLVRNAYFEPSNNPDIDYVSDCLSRIKTIFFMKKPVIIGAHRLNFIGFIDEKNRTKNLKHFRELLIQIKKNWPEVEFFTSDQLGSIILKSNE